MHQTSHENPYEILNFLKMLNPYETYEPDLYELVWGSGPHSAGSPARLPRRLPGPEAGRPEGHLCKVPPPAGGRLQSRFCLVLLHEPSE